MAARGVYGTVLIGRNQLHIFDNDNFSIIPKSIFSDNDNLPISCIMPIYRLSIIFSIISPTPISEKMPKAADEETETYAEEETEDESSTPTLVCTFLKCVFKVFLIMCWLRRRLPQTQGRWRRQRAPMKRTCSSLSRKRTTRRRRAGVVARGPGLPTGGTVPANGLQ